MRIRAVVSSGGDQVVGVQWVLTLLITPAAAAQKLTAHPVIASLLSVVIAATCTMGGILISLVTPYPASFYVSALSFGSYLLARVIGPRLTAASRRSAGQSRGEAEVAAITKPSESAQRQPEA